MGKIAFVFSGQGAQKSGMGRNLAETSKAAADVFNMADRIRPGTSLQCFNGTAKELALTCNTQPCLFCADLAAARALKEEGVTPHYLAGFSLGEIPALAFGGYLTDEVAFRFVVKRAKYMDLCGQKNPGIMYAALGLRAREVEDVCQLSSGCFPVNYNEETQIVVSCKAEAAKAFSDGIIAKGGRVLRLPVSGGFHSTMMNEARELLEKEFGMLTFSEPDIPVFSNVTAAQYESTAQLFRQVNTPVLWYQLIRNLAALGVDIFIETGTGRILANLIKKIVPDVRVFNVEDYKGVKYVKEVIEGVNE